MPSPLPACPLFLHSHPHTLPVSPAFVCVQHRDPQQVKWRWFPLCRGKCRWKGSWLPWCVLVMVLALVYRALLRCMMLWACEHSTEQQQVSAGEIGTQLWKGQVQPHFTGNGKTIIADFSTAEAIGLRAAQLPLVTPGSHRSPASVLWLRTARMVPETGGQPAHLEIAQGWGDTQGHGRATATAPEKPIPWHSPRPAAQAALWNFSSLGCIWSPCEMFRTGSNF